MLLLCCSAGLATATKFVRLQAGSVVTPLHNPIRMAEEWSVVDNLSLGRVGVAFATGSCQQQRYRCGLIIVLWLCQAGLLRISSCIRPTTHPASS